MRSTFKIEFKNFIMSEIEVTPVENLKKTKKGGSSKKAKYGDEDVRQISKLFLGRA
jgi:hypothetical protein